MSAVSAAAFTSCSIPAPSSSLSWYKHMVGTYCLVHRDKAMVLVAGLVWHVLQRPAGRHAVGEADALVAFGPGGVPRAQAQAGWSRRMRGSWCMFLPGQQRRADAAVRRVRVRQANALHVLLQHRVATVGKAQRPVAVPHGPFVQKPGQPHVGWFRR